MSGDPARVVALNTERQFGKLKIGSENTAHIVLVRIMQILQDAGLPDAALDARIFVEEATGLDRAALLRGNDRPIGMMIAETLEGWIVRRLTGEPVWRILGRREFWGLRFAVTPDVLDPRPDTETLVSAACAAVVTRRRTPLRILDLGVGSGAILAAILTECPQASGWGVDRSIAACSVARRNLAALQLADRALIVNGDWGASFLPGGFDLVVSNPPYIETAVIPMLDREVRDHDPHEALDGGPDGLACYRGLALDVSRLLVPGGVAVLEVGLGQAEAVQALLVQRGLVHEATRRDLGGVKRAVVVRKP